jgi:hypothetical protein
VTVLAKVLLFIQKGESSVQIEFRANELAQALNKPSFGASTLPRELSSNGFDGIQVVEMSGSASVNEAEGALTNDSAEDPPGTPIAVVLVVVLAILSGAGAGVAMYFHHAQVGQSKMPGNREETTPLVV